MKNLSTDQPVYIGFSGPAGSGKTATAKLIVPTIRVSLYGDVGDSNEEDDVDIVWDHFWLSAPLYALHNIRTTITGDDSQDRMLYAIHEIANSVMKEKIEYEELIELVYDVLAFPLTDIGDKPRTFLQQVGDLFINRYKNCFADYTKYKVHNTWQHLNYEYDSADRKSPLYLAIVSDVRMPHEAEMIKTRPQHCLIKFTADEETRTERLLDRDGMALDSTQSVHKTETGVAEIPDEWYDAIIDTTDLTLEEQRELVFEAVLGSHGYKKK